MQVLSSNRHRYAAPLSIMTLRVAQLFVTMQLTSVGREPPANSAPP